MNDYDSFYLSKRINLNSELSYLSAGLQPRFLIIKNEENSRNDLITFSSDNYMMGGGFYWKQMESKIHPDSGKSIPYYSSPRRVESAGIYKFHENKNLVAQYDRGFFSVLEMDDNFNFKHNEELSEKFGVGLLDVNLGTYKIAKIIVRDLNNNGLPDVIIGGNDWREYPPGGKRWGEEGYQPFDEHRNYRGGPLHGRVHVYMNLGLNPEDEDSYKFADDQILENVDQYGFCTPCFADFTNNGREDMICGNFIRDLTYFVRKSDNSDDQKQGAVPSFQKGINFMELPGPINFVECVDFNNNGLIDLLVSSENGYIYFIENTGDLTEQNIPRFEKPIRILQEKPSLKSDVLAVPAIFPESNGKINLVCGNAAGLFDYFEDISNPILKGTIKEIARILPPLPGGSIQGPSEIAWGYVCPTIFDWNENGNGDLVFSDINGEHWVSINTGTNEKPKFTKPLRLKEGNEEIPITTVWRVRPSLIKQSDGKIAYYCLDEDAKLVKFIKSGEDNLTRIGRVLTVHDKEISFTDRFGGSRGRMKLCIDDWTGNGVPDLLLGFPKGHNFTGIFPDELKSSYKHTPYASIAIMENKGTDMEFKLEPPKYFIHNDINKPPYMGHHSCSPDVVMLEGEKYIVVGSEDGQLYKFKKSNLTY